MLTSTTQTEVEKICTVFQPDLFKPREKQEPLADNTSLLLKTVVPVEKQFQPEILITMSV